jgi:5-methylcytosine-specific restriction endonuclease McrA
MQPHVKAYFKHFGYDESSRFLCEHCHRAIANQIHHIEPRSKFGSKRKDEQDDVNNLIGLCYDCHDQAHGILSKVYKTLFKQIIANR